MLQTRRRRLPAATSVDSGRSPSFHGARAKELDEPRRSPSERAMRTGDPSRRSRSQPFRGRIADEPRRGHSVPVKVERRRRDPRRSRLGENDCCRESAGVGAASGPRRVGRFTPRPDDARRGRTMHAARPGGSRRGRLFPGAGEQFTASAPAARGVAWQAHRAAARRSNARISALDQRARLPSAAARVGRSVPDSIPARSASARPASGSENTTIQGRAPPGRTVAPTLRRSREPSPMREEWTT